MTKPAIILNGYFSSPFCLQSIRVKIKGQEGGENIGGPLQFENGSYLKRSTISLWELPR